MSATSPRPGFMSTLNGLLLKIGAVALASVATVEVFTLIGLYNLTVPPIVLNWGAVIGTGIVSGLWSRFLLRRNTSLLRTFAALFALLVSLTVQYMITSGEQGINLFRRVGVEPNWEDLFQVSVGSIAALLALLAWRRAVRVGPASAEQDAAETGSQMLVDPEARSRRLAASNGNQRGGIRRRISLAQMLRPRVRSNGQVRSRNGRLIRRRNLKARLGLRFFNRYKPVQFVGEETHVCPYCLEEVASRDPRGVEICDICGTHHHADCWSVTGVCQVPHLQD